MTGYKINRRDAAHTWTVWQTVPASVCVDEECESPPYDADELGSWEFSITAYNETDESGMSNAVELRTQEISPQAHGIGFSN